MVEEALLVEDLQRETARTINTLTLIQSSPEQLKLFSAKVNGNWICKDECLTEVLNGAIPKVIEKVTSGESISPSQQICAVFDGEVPRTGVIHILCVIPSTSDDGSTPNKRRRLLSEVEQHTPDQFFRLSDKDVKDSGLLASSLYLYCRPAFHELFAFLREKVCDEGCLGRIAGPPGCGKSVNALVFASTLDKSEWIVTWIKLSTMLDGRFVQVNGRERVALTFDIHSRLALDRILCVDDNNKRHLVLIDGWNRDAFTTVSRACNEWFLERGESARRRLVYISSLASDNQFSEELEKTTRATRFLVPSWTLADYHAAVQSDEFFESVSTYLDTSEVLSDGTSLDKSLTPAIDPKSEMESAVVPYAHREAMVEAKYYYAGGCCRYMFQFGTRAVCEKLDMAVEWARRVGSVASFEDDSCIDTSRLFAVFPVPDSERTMQFPVSKYVATELAIICSESALRNFMSTRRHWVSRVPEDSWMLEMLFFTSLRFTGIALLDKDGQEIGTWDRYWVGPWIGIPSDIPDGDMWIKPTHRHPDGFDAIKTCKQNGLVRFVWVTSSPQYAFRIEHIHEWLTKLSRSRQHFEVKQLEVFFIVDQSKIVEFRLDPICGVGLLADYGWPEFEEVGRVQIVGMQSLCRPGNVFV